MTATPKELLAAADTCKTQGYDVEHVVKRGHAAELLARHIIATVKDDDDDEQGFLPDADWVKKNKHRKQEAKDMGISIDKYNYHTGSSKALTLFLNGTFWEEVSDAYYGVTHYDWSEFQDVTEDEIATLSKFYPVKDIRKK